MWAMKAIAVAEAMVFSRSFANLRHQPSHARHMRLQDLDDSRGAASRLKDHVIGLLQCGREWARLAPRGLVRGGVGRVAKVVEIGGRRNLRVT
jgi:hypothetical protein